MHSYNVAVINVTPIYIKIQSIEDSNLAQNDTFSFSNLFTRKLYSVSIGTVNVKKIPGTIHFGFVVIHVPIQKVFSEGVQLFFFLLFFVDYRREVPNTTINMISEPSSEWIILQFFGVH